VMPALNAHIKQLFGFDFSEVLNSIGDVNKPKRGHKRPKKVASHRGRKAIATKSRKKR
jgi:hypothetical protein